MGKGGGGDKLMLHGVNHDVVPDGDACFVL